MDIVQALNWRYAAKRMTGQTIPADKLNTILESIRLSASSVGLQPYTVFVVSSQEMRGKIREMACKQPQVTESSHFLVFTVNENITEAYIDYMIGLTASTRNVGMDTLAGFQTNIKKMLLSRSVEENFDWAARQSYIALGYGLVAAAVEGVDSTPMEGFDHAAMDEVLGLKQHGLKSIVALALGYRDEQNDYLVKAAKVRKPADSFFVTL